MQDPLESAKVLEYQPLVQATARRIKTQLEFEDRCQEGNLGLLYALKHFDEGKAAAKQTCFAAYATRCIRGYILRGTFKNCNQFGLSDDKFWRKHGISVASLEAIPEGQQPLELQLAAPTEGPSEQPELRQTLERLMSTLTHREQGVLRLRHGWDGRCLTLKQVGAKYGVSGEGARLIQAKAERKLKAAAQSFLK